MQPARPDGDTKLPISNKDRPAEPNGALRDERAHIAEGDEPLRLLSQDGLRVGEQRDPAAADSDDHAARERALLALVSSARHELRSPLQSIQGFADLLASESYGALGRDQRAFVEHIIQGSWDLSRALDACFELVQAQALHLPTEPFPASVRGLLEEALTVAQNNGPTRFDVRLGALGEDPRIDVDLADFSKAVQAVITALTPLARGRIMVSAAAREGLIVLSFGIHDEPRSFRTLNELPRRSVSARALLWLRVAEALFARSQGRLETSESYDQVRILLPERCAD